MQNSKLSRDPTQSLWIEDKYAKDLKVAMDNYHEGLVNLATIDRDTIQAYKDEQMNTVFKPLAKKYVTMALTQGGKFAQVQLKKVKL